MHTVEKKMENRRSARIPAGVWGTAVLALSLLSGCGGGGEDATPTGTVSGKVTLADKPLSEGRINFISEANGVGASGNLQADGTYTLEGPLPVGKYAVFLTFEIAPSQLDTPAADVMKSVPEKYRGQGTSGLSADVTAEDKEYNFDLK